METFVTETHVEKDSVANLLKMLVRKPVDYNAFIAEQVAKFPDVEPDPRIETSRPIVYRRTATDHFDPIRDLHATGAQGYQCSWWQLAGLPFTTLFAYCKDRVLFSNASEDRIVEFLHKHGSLVVYPDLHDVTAVLNAVDKVGGVVV